MQQELAVNDKVFIKDEDHAWLPAKVVESARDRILVEIDLPSDWVRTTTTSTTTTIKKDHFPQRHDNDDDDQQQQDHHHHSSPQQGERRWVELDEYKDRMLPLQNNTTSSSARDIAELPHLHEAAVLYQIKSRMSAKKPYTRVGDIMIALNPCQWIDKLYTSEQRHMYAKSFVWQEVPDMESEETKEESRSSTPSASSTSYTTIYDRLGFEPHIYEVSALAYRGLFLQGKNQTILVSGESGAGKTETVKIVLKHLAGLETAALMDSGDDDKDITSGGVGSGNELVRHIVESSPIFEAFGNAKTLRNHNSSRFGKMTRLHFGTGDNGMCGLRGSTCKTYLLETSRVVHQTKGERNFHIFYQLLAAPSQVKRHLLGHERWEFAKPADFRYLNEPNVKARIGTATDKDLWLETLRALDFFQWKRSKLETLLQALGIILLLGNVVFTELPSGQGCFVSTLEELIQVADALGIPVDVIEKAMTRQVIKTTLDRVEVPMSPEVAKDCLDALVKKIYACVFDSVVCTINEQTHDADISQTDGIISLLDIYGFESFEVNRFEQLCINYANEKLHKKYVNDTFSRVQVEYEEEGIQVFDFEIVDNSNVLDIFEGRSGLMSGIDEECVRRNGCSKEFVRKAKIKNGSNERFIDRTNFHDAEFGVSHFAGPVIYDATSFVERNTDKLPHDLLAMVVNTSNPLIHEAFTELLKQDKARKMSDIGRKSATGRTVLEKFKIELKELMASIAATQTRYIRCIKPNEKLSARSVDHRTVVRQLRCAGIVAAIDLSRESFPSKLQFQDVEDRFKCLMKENQTLVMKEMDAKDRAQYMMSVLYAPLLEVYRNCDFTLPYACGKSSIYYRAGALELLEGIRQEYFSCRAAKIQRWRVTTNGQRDFRRFRRAMILLQAKVRTYFAYQSFRVQKEAAMKIQSIRRGHLLKTQYDQMTIGFTRLQQRYQIVAERRRQDMRIKSATQVQALSRSWISRSRYCRVKRGFVGLQAQYRAVEERKQWPEIVRAVSIIKSICYTHALTRRFLRTRKGFVLLQAQSRGVSDRRSHAQSRATLERAIRVERESAAAMIKAWLQTLVAKAHFRQMKSGFVRFQAQYRGGAERKRRDEYKMASSIMTSSVRMHIHRIRFLRLVHATSLVQRSFRSKLRTPSPAIAPTNSSSKNAETQQALVNSLREDGTDRNTATSVVQKAPVNISFKEEETASSSKDDLAKEASSSCLESAALGGDNGQDRSESPFLKKNVAADKSVDGGLEAQIRSLQQKLERRTREVDDLHQDIAQVTKEAEIHKQEIEAEYEERLAAYEEEVLQLKRTIQEDQFENRFLRKELEENQERHEGKVERMMRDSYHQSEEFKEHLLQLSVQIEKAKKARATETEDIMSQIATLKSEKNEKILHLQAQLARVRSTMMAPALTVASPDESEWSSIDHQHAMRALSEGKGSSSYLEEVDKLRRDLLTIAATHNLVELVDKANSRPWQKDVHIERLYRSVETRVTRLADLAVQSYMSEEPTVKHMHVNVDPSPTHVDVSRQPSPTSTLDDDSSYEP